VTAIAAPGGPPAATDRWASWDRFLAATPSAGFMQSSWWADFRTHAGYGYFGAVLRSGHRILGGAVVMRFSYAPEHCFYYIPDGPVLPEDESQAPEVFAAILDDVECHRRAEPETVSHLRIEPRWFSLPGFVAGFRPVPVLGDGYMEPRDTLYVDLRPSEAGILAQMKPKGRYNIGLAQRHGVSVVEDNSERGLADFLAIYQDTAERQAFGAKPPDYFETLVSLLTSRQQGALYFAEYQGTRVAGAVVVWFGRRATYFYGGSLPPYRRVMAPYLLHYQIMLRAKAMGLDWYDFWGIAPADQPGHPWEGITTFKHKFGGVDIRLVPTLDYVYDRRSYDHYMETVTG
jgi:lipid II:glycine glycyltransferase (peptidoglycan interpeptide bridge formation enzyme)